MENFEKEEKQETIIEDNKENIIVSGLGKYDKVTDKKHRYCLSVDIKNGAGKELTVIMLNPSEAKEKKNSKGFFIDQTITNVIKMAYSEGYGRIIILNLFSVINPNSDEVQLYFQQNNDCSDEYAINKINIDYIKSVIDKSDNILVAWGERFINTTRHKQVKDVIDKLKSKQNILTFCMNGNRNYPKHPGRIDLDCCRNCYRREGKIKLIPYEFI